MRQILLYAFTILCGVPCVHASNDSYKELLMVHKNPQFLYEQTEMPAELRSFFIPLALARYEIASNTAWADRIVKLLHSLHIPPSVHYVSPEYAPFTYADVGVMAQRMKIETPLLFLTGKNNSIKTIEAIRLDGTFYGLVCNRSFIKRRSSEECRVLIAHELARIAQRRCHRPKLAKKIWLGAVLTIVALVLMRHAYKTIRSSGDFKSKIRSFSRPFIQFAQENWWWYTGSTLLVIGSKIGAEFIGAYLSRKYQHEADLLAFKGFGGAPDDYLDVLRLLEDDEMAYRQKMVYQYKKHYAYVSERMDALADTVHPYILCFLKNELSRHAIKEVDRPATSEQAASLLNLESSLDDRIAYLYENLRSKKKDTDS